LEVLSECLATKVNNNHCQRNTVRETLSEKHCQKNTVKLIYSLSYTNKQKLPHNLVFLIFKNLERILQHSFVNHLLTVSDFYYILA